MGLYRGVGLDEALKSIKVGHLIYYSKDPMSYDWEVIEYGLGGSTDMSEEEVGEYVKEIVPWNDVSKGVNLTTDLENAMGYSHIVFEVEVNGNYAEFSKYHIFAEKPKNCSIERIYYKGETITSDELLNIGRNMVNEDKIKGGKADKMSKKDIADKFNVTLSKVEKELRMGVKIEKEHTGSATMAKEIAMDHLVEIPDYYTRLKKMEKEAKKDWDVKIDESTSDYLKRILREQIELTVVDETAVSTDYDIYHNDRKAGVLTLSSHNPTLPKGAIELVIIQIAEKYRGLKLGYEVVKQIWRKNPDINQIFLIPTTQSKLFWDKIGATRLNDTYYVIYKGHS